MKLTRKVRSGDPTGDTLEVPMYEQIVRAINQDGYWVTPDLPRAACKRLFKRGWVIFQPPVIVRPKRTIPKDRKVVKQVVKRKKTKSN